MDLPEEFLCLWKTAESREDEETLWKQEEMLDEELEEFCRWDEQVEVQKYREQEEQEEHRDEGWKPSEMNLLLDLELLLSEKKMDELEGLYEKNIYEKKLALMDKKPMCVLPGEDSSGSSEWTDEYAELASENITSILAMRYTNGGVPQYVYEGQSDSLQVYSVKVAGTKEEGLQVYGVVFVRDSIDSRRNLIFNRGRHDCQIITKEDPYLVLTGPTRAVGMNRPVIIEAQLKVKGAVESEDKCLLAQAKTVPLMSGLGKVELTAGRDDMKLNIAVGGLVACVEATIFIQRIDGIWPDGFHGQFAAHTTSIGHKKIILLEIRGDDAATSGGAGNMEHLRHVVSVEACGELTVSFKAWKGDEEVMTGGLMFKAAMSGRSFGYLKVGSCNLGVLVVWSCIRPLCEESVSSALMRLVF